MDFIKARAKEVEMYCIELLKIPGVQTDPVFVNFFQLYNLVRLFHFSIFLLEKPS